mgnify:FL=1
MPKWAKATLQADKERKLSTRDRVGLTKMRSSTVMSPESIAADDLTDQSPVNLQSLQEAIDAAKIPWIREVLSTEQQRILKSIVSTPLESK